MFQEALSAIDNQERSRARDLLTRLLKNSPNHPEYWLWLSSVVDSSKERTFCLKEVLRLDPQNEAARRGLVLLGVIPGDPSLAAPLSAQKRNWQSALQKELAQDQKGATGRNLALYGGGLLVVIALGIVAVTGFRNARWARGQAIAPSNFQPVAAITATFTPSPTVTPLPAGPTPPWSVLAQPYTPTPLYVNTPHPRTEAYRIGMRAYEAGEWAKAIDYFGQVAAGEPEAADMIYLRGEAYRQSGQVEAAIESYNRAIEVDDTFAPAYLGRARGVLAMDADKFTNQAVNDTERALQLDPNLAEAYLELAALHIRLGNPEQALADLDNGADLLAGSPLLYYTRALAYFDLDVLEQAETNVNQALRADLTLIDAYRLKGKILQADGRVVESYEPLDVYSRYAPSQPDAEFLTLYGLANLATGRTDEALQAFAASLEQELWQFDVYLQRGLLYLQLEDGELALDDFDLALRLQARSFPATLGKGRAMLLLERYRDAYLSFNVAESLAEEDSQLAEVFYWRALSLEPANPDAAANDWDRLLALDPDAITAEQRQAAEDHLAVLRAPTVTPTLRSTVTPTPTRTPTARPTTKPRATATPR